MDDDLELIHGSGNVFADTGMPNPQLEQLRAVLAAHIIKALDERGLTVRAAEELTGIAAADFSRIRRVKLDRFTVDRLMKILDKLGFDVAIDIRTAPKSEEVTPKAA